jgi:hypothetical protein
MSGFFPAACAGRSASARKLAFAQNDEWEDFCSVSYSPPKQLGGLKFGKYEEKRSDVNMATQIIIDELTNK